MKYTQIIAQPDYDDLVSLFNSSFKTLEKDEHFIKYQTELKLKIYLRFEMNIKFKTIICLKKKGNFSEVTLFISNVKIILWSALMFGFITLITHLIKSSYLSLIFGLISGFIIFFMLKSQILNELEKYFKTIRCSFKKHLK
jgi:hypothetical protein